MQFSGLNSAALASAADLFLGAATSISAQNGCSMTTVTTGPKPTGLASILGSEPQTVCACGTAQGQVSYTTASDGSIYGACMSAGASTSWPTVRPTQVPTALNPIISSIDNIIGSYVRPSGMIPSGTAWGSGSLPTGTAASSGQIPQPTNGTTVAPPPGNNGTVYGTTMAPTTPATTLPSAPPASTTRASGAVQLSTGLWSIAGLLLVGGVFVAL